MTRHLALLAFVAVLGGCGGGDAGDAAVTAGASTVLAAGISGAGGSTSGNTASSGTVTVAAASSAAGVAAPDPVSTLPTPWMVGHRGSPGGAPENTLASYRLAMTKHADFGETDVALTSDGEVVVMHDATLERTTNVRELFPHRAPWKVSSFTLAEIRQLDAGKWFSDAFAGEKVPTLAELLALLKSGNTGLFLELKSADAELAAKTAAQLRASGWVQGNTVREKLVVISFNSDHLRKFHALMPSVNTWLLISTPPPEAQLADIASFANGIDMNYTNLNPALSALYARHDLMVGAYTVDITADIDTMLHMSLTGITTDNLDYLRAHVPAR